MSFTKILFYSGNTGFILFISVLAYYYFSFHSIIQYIDNNYTLNTLCKFDNTSIHNISHNRLMINADIIDNTTEISHVNLYYPLIYIGIYVDKSEYTYFYNKLLDKTFNCTINPKTNTAYFNDYNNFPSIINMDLISQTNAYILVCLIFISTLFVLFNSRYLYKYINHKSTRYSYYVLDD